MNEANWKRLSLGALVFPYVYIFFHIFTYFYVCFVCASWPVSMNVAHSGSYSLFGCGLQARTHINMMHNMRRTRRSTSKSQSDTVGSEESGTATDPITSRRRIKEQLPPFWRKSSRQSEKNPKCTILCGGVWQVVGALHGKGLQPAVSIALAWNRRFCEEQHQSSLCHSRLAPAVAATRVQGLEPCMSSPGHL